MSDPVAAKLNDIRLREGLGVNEMAHRIGANPGQLSRVLNGKAELTRRMLDRAATVYPELLDAYAASLNITAKTPHEEPDATRDLDATTTTDSDAAVRGMRQAAPTSTAAVSRDTDAIKPLPVL